MTVKTQTKMTQTQTNRDIAADTLRAVARLIEMGAIEGIDIVWTEADPKPVGKYIITSEFLKSPLEQELEKDPPSAKIQVEDLS